jgi:hypothetical protein
MKNVRMILSAVVIFAAVGTGLAFKSAQKGQGTLFCQDGTAQSCAALNYSPGAGSPLLCGATANDCINNPTSTNVVFAE